jgi:hypothetical protein
VLDKSGRVIDAEVPSTLPDAIEGKASARSRQGRRAVSATVTSIRALDAARQTYIVEITTRRGQLVTLEMAAAAVSGMKVGHKLRLRLP